MRITVAALVAAVAVGASGVASASTTKTPYRTEKQAENYLQHLRYWHGVNVGSDPYRIAFCTGSPLLLNRYNGKGENIYQRFSCSLSSHGRTFNIKVWTKAHGWRLKPGRFSD